MGEITLIAKVLGGRCPGVTCPGVQLSYEEIAQVQLSASHFPGWELSEG